jgi:peptidyl-dipeptidase Dcp
MNLDPLAFNPLLRDWTGAYGLPPFGAVQAAHFLPAFEVAQAGHLAELDAIASNAAPASFTNTLLAFDESGRLYRRIELLFHNLAVSETSPALQAVERELAPRQAAHETAIYLRAKLFARIDALYQRREFLGLEPAQLRLLERVQLDFVRAGAKLPGADRERYAAVMQELASLCAQFGQNVLADEAGFALELKNAADLAGLPPFLLAAAEAAAAQRGLPEGSHAITLSPSMADPFLTFSARRDLRETLWRARVARGAHVGHHDNRALAARIIALRQEQAALHGYASYADYQLVDRMAGNTAAVIKLLTQAWEPAKKKAQADHAALVAMAAKLAEPTELAAWDWRYLAEKVRQQRYRLDDAEVKPYFALENMIQAMFDCAQRLFGIRFVEQHGQVLHHPDARLWEVRSEKGELVGIFIGDNYARASKRSGAWMSVFRSQSGHQGGTLPIVINNTNFAKVAPTLVAARTTLPPEGAVSPWGGPAAKPTPTLLSFADVRTLFHEFGHGLHGLLSQVQYERLAGTQVLRDFVELPSQLFENWAEQEEVLKRHARHYASRETIPTALLAKLKQARQFDQAWATVQYVGPALIDMALHALPNGTPVDIAAFEAEQCRLLGVPSEVGLRHHLSHFQHLFCGPAYAAGYYVYMWAEVLEADGFEAFTQAGNPFDAVIAERLLRCIYRTGNQHDPADAYRAFRGRDPSVGPMLRKRGLV